jgi:hypothetical protein
MSLEAAAVAAALQATAAAPPASGPVALEAARFASPGRARALVARALRAGFPEAKVAARGDGAARTYAVVLGHYPDAALARKAQARAARELGISARLTGER